MQKVKRKSSNLDTSSSPLKKPKTDNNISQNEDKKKLNRTQGKEFKKGKVFNKNKQPGKDFNNFKKQGVNKSNFNKGGKSGNQNNSGEKPKWSETKKEKKELRLTRRKAKATAEVFEISHKAKLLAAQIQRYFSFVVGIYIYIFFFLLLGQTYVTVLKFNGVLKLQESCQTGVP